MRIISEEVRCIPAFFVKMSGLFWPVLCIIIDAGFAGNSGLHEMQRHLKLHGISVRTIGIDVHEFDAEVDEFVHADMRDVKLPGAADMVIFRGVVHHFDGSAADFQRAVGNCADWLKPDRVLFTDIERWRTLAHRLWRYRPGIVMRAMSKNEAKEHADECHLESDECPHGEELRLRWFMRLK